MTSDIFKQNFELKKENTELKKEVKRLSNALSYANNRIKQLENQLKIYKNDEEKRIEEIVSKTVNTVVEKINKEHKEEVDKLNAKIKRLESRLNIDSTNSGTPTSKETIGKHTIQNNREKSDKPKGAQLNHKQYKLNYFKNDEITKTDVHELDMCPYCNGELIEKIRLYQIL